MQIQDNIKTSVTSILANKLRSFLTILGIMIGIASVVIVVSLSLSGQTYIMNQINDLGTNVLWGYWKNSSVDSLDNGNINLEDMEAISHIPGVIASTPLIFSYMTIFVDNREKSLKIIGVNEEYSKIRNPKVITGRFFNKIDVNNGAKVCLITKQLAKDMFINKSPIGQELSLNNMGYTIIGIIDNSSIVGSEITSETVFVPLPTINYIRYTENKVDYIDVKISESVSSQVMKDRIIRLLEQRHNRYNEYVINSLDTLQNIANNISMALTAIFSVIAGISLLVGGIGIMNIMLVSVVERTKEIGIRIAVGATKKDILLQFLMESVIISVIGGVIGILISLFSFVVIQYITHYPLFINYYSIVVALIVSLLIGLFFGLYPANRAANLNPIESLRYE